MIQLSELIVYLFKVGGQLMKKIDKSFWNRDVRDLLNKNRKTSPKELTELCRQMAFMLEAGVSLKGAIEVLVERYNGLQTVLDMIMRGESLSHSIENAGNFPAFMSNMCRIGEVSDNLPQVMAHLADYYEQIQRTKDEISSALLYPAIVTAIMLITTIVAVTFVLPQYAVIFAASGVPLPALTQWLLDVSNSLTTGWYWILPTFILILIIPVAIFRNSTGRKAFEYALLYMPVARVVYRRIVNLHIVQAMTILLQSGMPLETSVLAVSRISNNSIVKQDLQKVVAGLAEGAVFWTQLAAIAYIDPLLTSMARVGDETGDMPKSFKYAHIYSSHQFKQMTRRMNKLVEPIITLILGLVLGVVMLSIILPTFALTDLAI